MVVVGVVVCARGLGGGGGEGLCGWLADARREGSEVLLARAVAVQWSGVRWSACCWRGGAGGAGGPGPGPGSAHASPALDGAGGHGALSRVPSLFFKGVDGMGAVPRPDALDSHRTTAPDGAARACPPLAFAECVCCPRVCLVIGFVLLHVSLHAFVSACAWVGVGLCVPPGLPHVRACCVQPLSPCHPLCGDDARYMPPSLGVVFRCPLLFNPHAPPPHRCAMPRPTAPPLPPGLTSIVRDDEEPDHDRPINPYLNSGALVLCSLLGRGHLAKEERLFNSTGSRFTRVLSMMRELAGNNRVGFSKPAFLTLKQKALRVRGQRAVVWFL